MNTPRLRLNPLLAALLGGSALLFGCHKETVIQVVAPDARVVEGTAAVGAALSLATVSITDARGARSVPSRPL